MAGAAPGCAWARDLGIPSTAASSCSTVAEASETGWLPASVEVPDPLAAAPGAAGPGGVPSRPNTTICCPSWSGAAAGFDSPG